MQYSGLLIRRERQKRNWSQEGLCRGICAVSYLSKIEQGKAAVSDDILRLLLQRLDLPWYDSQADLTRGQSLCQDGYDALLAADFPALGRVMEQAQQERDRLENGPFAPDFLLLSAFWSDRNLPLDASLEPCLDNRQLALQRVLQDRVDEALRLYPCGYIAMQYGNAAYVRGDNTVAVQRLETAYQMAATAGQARLMLQCRLLMGNCYSNQKDVPSMLEHYRVAERLAEAVGDSDALASIRYNTAATRLDTGDYDAAYGYLHAMETPTRMSLHKLAVCCERLGRKEEALSALDRAASLPEEQNLPGEAALVGDMLRTVRLRLETPEYLHDPAYGALLLDVFERCRKRLPVGYAAFHLPWVLEWHTANRQYKQAYELLLDFPAIKK